VSKIVCNVCGDAVQCYDPEDLGLGCKKAPCPGHYCLERDLEDPDERDQLRADIAAQRERADSLERLLPGPGDVAYKTRALLAEDMEKHLRTRLEAAEKVVEAVKAHREFVRGQFEKLSLTGECDVIFNLGEILDDCLSGKKPEGI